MKLTHDQIIDPETGSPVGFLRTPNGELLIQADRLPDPVPSVRHFGGSMIIFSLDRDGAIVEQDIYQQRCLRVGDRVLGIIDRQQQPWQRVGDEFVHPVTTLGVHYISGDKLIAAPMDEDLQALDATVVVSADQPLPNTDPAVHGYRPRGLITAEGELIAWGYDGKLDTNAVELALVAKAVRTTPEWQAYHFAHLAGASLTGTLATRPVAAAYLHDFDRTNHTDYLPTQELSMQQFRG